MDLHRRNLSGTGYVLEVKGRERFVDNVIAFDKTGAIIRTSPSSMANEWPYAIKIPDTEIAQKRKPDFTRKKAFVTLTSPMPGFTARYILYLPADMIGLSDPVYEKDVENMCFVETRTTAIDGFFFRTYHFFNGALNMIDSEISQIGARIQSQEWRWSKSDTLSSLIQRLDELSTMRDQELERLRNITAEDLLK